MSTLSSKLLGFVMAIGIAIALGVTTVGGAVARDDCSVGAIANLQIEGPGDPGAFAGEYIGAINVFGGGLAVIDVDRPIVIGAVPNPAFTRDGSQLVVAIKGGPTLACVLQPG